MAEFRFIGGDLTADFLNTIDWTTPAPSQERLVDGAALIRWSLAARLLTPSAAAALRRRAADRPREAVRAHVEAVRIRAVLERLFGDVVAGRWAPPDAVAELNRSLSRVLPDLEVTLPTASPSGRWVWTARRDDFVAPLRPVLWAAANLLVSPELERLRRCGGADCRWFYLDRSRNGLRRWCAMETCGTREKNRRRSLAAD